MKKKNRKKYKKLLLELLGRALVGLAWAGIIILFFER